ncbi:MAG TPA: YihY/virulence factor BrkB family protein [Desulfobacteraceae bacterium]|nr:YihY/virulence factor BrkB family protein [Desulfobacteraceae bacterium]
MPTLKKNSPRSNFRSIRADRVVTLSGRGGGLKQWAFRLNHDDNGLQASVRSWLRIFFIMAHEFPDTAITIRAAALTYSIVLSMVPILAMSTAVLKGLGSDNQIKIAAYAFIDQLEPGLPPEEKSSGDPARISPESDTGQEITATAEPPPDTAPPSADRRTLQETARDAEIQSLTNHLRSAVDTIFDYVDRTNFAALGAFGIAGLLLAVVLVLSTIESAMNEIWHTKEGRSVSRKVMDYLALLILLPISINLALAGDAVLESPRMMSYLHTIIPSVWAVATLLKLLPFFFVVLTLMVMYQFFPNVRVKTHAALAGALFAGFFWFVVQRVYIVLQIGVAKYNAIYGSFATVPLFLIWIHLGWTFILLGASLAYAVQNRNQYQLPGKISTPQRDLQLAFDILNTTYANFARKTATTIDDLALANKGDELGNIQEITDRLIDGGLLYRTENDGPGFVPAAPSENIEAREVVRLILGHEDIPTPGGEFSQRVIKAAEAAIPPEAFPLADQPIQDSQALNQHETHEETP